MHSRTTRRLIAFVFAVFVSISASAAPEGRSESREWLSRQIDRIVLQITKLFAPQPLDDPNITPPKP
jgi:hypothetical protein